MFKKEAISKIRERENEEVHGASLTYGSLFSGVGGFDRGFDLAGMKCLWQCEKDPHCLQVLEKRWPGVRRFTDVRKVGADAPRVDVVCGGFPCQDLSIAGRRAGLAGARSGLYFEFERILKELRPWVCVIENVPGLLSSNGGRDFAIILYGLQELGYRVAWRICDSQYYGVAQRRRRVFIVGSLGNGSCAEILFEPESLSWDSAPCREAGQRTSALAASGAGTSRTGNARTEASFLVPEVAGTLGGGAGARGWNIDLDNSGAFIPEVARCVQSRQTRIDGETETFLAFSCKDHGADAGDLSPTLRSMSFDESHINGGGQVAVAFSIQHAQLGRKDEAGPQGKGWQEDLAFTLDSRPVADVVAAGMAVRRLTPTECSRLQGFPDDHNDFMSDAQRYKQFGNAVTVNVAEWLGKRLVAVAGTVGPRTIGKETA